MKEIDIDQHILSANWTFLFHMSKVHMFYARLTISIKYKSISTYDHMEGLWVRLISLSILGIIVMITFASMLESGNQYF